MKSEPPIGTMLQWMISSAKTMLYSPPEKPRVPKSIRIEAASASLDREA
jgi:hypothetical protein